MGSTLEGYNVVTCAVNPLNLTLLFIIVVNACLKGLNLTLFSPSTSEDCGTFQHAPCWGVLFPFYSKHQVQISEKNIIYNLLNLWK